MKIVFPLMFAMFSTFLLLLVLARPADHIERLEQQTDNATRNGPSEIEILPPCIAWTWHMPRPKHVSWNMYTAWRMVREAEGKGRRGSILVECGVCLILITYV